MENITNEHELSCEKCGKTFIGNGTTKYCPECRVLMAQNKGQALSNRLVGSEVKCEMCGKYYTVTSSRQKFCPECADKYRYLPSAGKAKTKWLSKNYDRVEVRIPKGEKANIQEHAKTHGEGINQFINRAIFAQIDRDIAESSDSNE